MTIAVMITLLIKILVSALTVYGLGELITLEDGPFGLFRRPREWLGRHPKTSYPDDIYDTEEVAIWRRKFAEASGLHEIWCNNDLKFLNSIRGTLYGIMSCGFCMGTWIGIIVTTLFVLAMPAATAWPYVILEAFTIFGGTLAGQRMLKARFD